MMITRRSLLQLALAAGATTVAGTIAASSFARAGAASGGGRGGRKLVLVELQGGNDGLNTVVPLRDALYRKLRPTLAVDDAIAIGAGVGLHPALAPLVKVFERGELAVVQGVGYPDPVRSHFRSADIWHTGSGATETRTDGWITRLLAGRAGAVPRGLLVAGDAGPLDGPGFAALAADGDRTSRRIDRPVTNAALAHLARVHDEVKAGRKEIDAALGEGASERAVRGKALVEQARLAAKALASLDVSVIKLTLGGFDTHANQKPAHARLLEELAAGLVELRARALSDGTWGSTIVATTSEFGRRARENASGGSDHGTAAPLFVMGGGVQGGVRGPAPRLDDLDAEGDVKMTTDYRAVLGGLAVSAWGLGGADVKRALGGVAPLVFT